jgi:hypothetical protein
MCLNTGAAPHHAHGDKVATGAASAECSAQRCGGLPHRTAIVCSATERVPRHAPETAQNRGFAPIWPKIQTLPQCGDVFYCAAYGRSCVFVPLGRGDIYCLYRDVRVPRRRALGLTLCQLVKQVAATLRRGCAPSGAAAFKNYSALLFIPKCFGIKCGLGLLSSATTKLLEGYRLSIPSFLSRNQTDAKALKFGSDY